MSSLGNKEVFASNLNRIMQERNISAQQICDDLNITKSSFSLWRNAKYYPRIDKIELLANYFGVKKSVLIEPLSSSDTILQLPEVISIPVLGRVAAGVPILAEENQIGTVNIEKSKAASSELFGLRIKGDSMSPRIQEGDIVIVRRQDDAESGDVVIALVNGDEAVCKKLQKYKEGISLISFNPSYEPMTYTDDDIRELPVKIIGKVIENRQFY